MTKDPNLKKQKNSRRRYRPFNELSLSKMPDDDLKKLYLEIRSIVNKGKRQNFDVKNSEIDFCYVQREIQFRKLYR